MSDILSYVLGNSLIRSVVTVALTVTVAMLAHAVVFFFLKKVYSRSDHLGTFVVTKTRAPARLVFLVVAIWMILPALTDTTPLGAAIRHATVIAFIVTAGLLAMAIVRGFVQLLLSQYDITARDNLKARTVSTQARVFQQIAAVIVAIVVVSTILMTFDGVQQLGASILASAGIAGLVLGVAAQKSLANVVAGVMIAITQPIRLDDVVIVEGEWGRIEEITLTYVVVSIWDKRRLIVPITHFVESPFQNWTRTSAEILGTVFLHVDYRTPIDAIRAEQSRILATTELWDRKVDVVQVVDSTDRSLVVRCLVSAADSPTAWDLRVLLREQLVTFLQSQYPEYLPRIRIENSPSPAPDPLNP